MRIFQTTGAGEHIPTYRLVGTKFWGKFMLEDELKAKLGKNSSFVGTKFLSWHQVEKRSPAPEQRKLLISNVQAWN